MRKLLTILFITIGSAKGQTLKFPLWFHCTDTAQYYNYYHGNGVLLWKQVKYDAALIPNGGYVVATGYVKSHPEMIKGFGIFVVGKDSVMTIIRRVDTNNKDIVGKIINPAILPR